MSARIIAQMLEKRGFHAFYVGGAVRDWILHLDPNDIDIATNATPEQVEAIFSPNHNVKTVGKSFGVVMVNGVEVATFRTDTYEGYDHKACAVNYAATIEEDLSRRDLTVNAMAMDLHSNLIDPFGGEQDTRNGLIKFVGNAADRIMEDPNRMLRACRFVAQLDGVMDYQTKKAIYVHSDLMRYVSPERIRLEVLKAMKARRASKFFYALHDCGLLGDVFPSLEACYNHTGGNYHPEDVFTHSMLTGDKISSRCPLTKLAGYLHDVGKPVTFDENANTFYQHEKVGALLVSRELTALRFSHDEVKAISGLVKMHMRTATVLTVKGVRRLLRKLSECGVYYRDYLRLYLADRNSNTGLDPMSIRDARYMVNSVEDQMSVEMGVTKVTDLAVNGHDVMNLTGKKPGPDIGVILSILLDMVIETPEINTKDELSKLIPVLF